MLTTSALFMTVSMVAVTDHQAGKYALGKVTDSKSYSTLYSQQEVIYDTVQFTGSMNRSENVIGNVLTQMLSFNTLK